VHIRQPALYTSDTPHCAHYKTPHIVHIRHPTLCTSDTPYCALQTSHIVHIRHPALCTSDTPHCAPQTPHIVHIRHPAMCTSDTPYCAYRRPVPGGCAAERRLVSVIFVLKISTTTRAHIGFLLFGERFSESYKNRPRGMKSDSNRRYLPS
jgi:hypothetical protein